MKIVTSKHPNIITILTSKVENSARLPLSVVRGTEKERYKLAQTYSDELVKELDKISDGKKCKTDDFIRAVDKITSPHKINFQVDKQESKFEIFSKTMGEIGIDYESQDLVKMIGPYTALDSSHYIIKGYSVKLPLNKDKTIIKNKYVALHEARHLFDHICNPKTIDMKSFKLLPFDEKFATRNKVYSAFIRKSINPFNGDKNLKKTAQAELNKLSDEEAIDCLQDIRHTLRSELNAYGDELNYMSRKRFSNFFHISGCAEFLNTHNYASRLRLANEMLAERLKIARENLKTQKS